MADKSTSQIWLAAVLIIVVLGFAMSVGGGGLSKADVTKIVSEEVAKIEIPTSENVTIPTAEEIAAFVVIPEVESADNALLNEFLKNEFNETYFEIEAAALKDATDELEKKDYRVVEEYLMTLLAEGEVLDEASIDVDFKDKDVDVVVTALGLNEDEDKSARVTFEIEVEYELEEGARDTFEKDMVVVFDVVYDEGDFSDEEVEFVSIA